MSVWRWYTALEYPLGGLTHCSHGAGNGLFLPCVMRFNLPRRERELAQVAEFLGVDTQGKSDRQAAEAAIEPRRANQTGYRHSHSLA